MMVLQLNPGQKLGVKHAVPAPHTALPIPNTDAMENVRGSAFNERIFFNS
jgi:hypothetical protein